jgi:small subunit ribosomal protein S16
MSVKIRLFRVGKKNNPSYRLVACDESAKRNGKFIEILGTHDPIKNPAQSVLKKERIAYWLEKGATPSDTVRHILKKQKIKI